MATGLEMLAKASGIDLKKVGEDFTALKDGVTKTLAAIDARLTKIETQNEQILANQDRGYRIALEAQKLCQTEAPKN